jgi:hypothetical protein
MTWDEFLASDLTLEQYVAERVQAAVADLPIAATTARIESETAAAERRIAELEFEKLVDQNARLGGVIPTAVPLIVSDVRKLFEMRENALVVRNGETMPGDPLTPLTFEVWLQEFRKDHEFLFVK